MTFKLSPKELENIRQITIDGDTFKNTYVQRKDCFYCDGETISIDDLSKTLNYEFSRMADGTVSILYNDRHTEILEIVDGQASFTRGS